MLNPPNGLNPPWVEDPPRLQRLKAHYRISSANYNQPEDVQNAEPEDTEGTSGVPAVIKGSGSGGGGNGPSKPKPGSGS